MSPIDGMGDFPGLAAVEFQARDLDPATAAAAYRTWGCLVVRGLMAPWVDAVRADLEATAAQSLSLLSAAERIPEGWRTPDGTLFIPAPDGYTREQQLMVLATNYQTSAAFLASAMNPILLDLVEAIVGPNVELFGMGQCLYKEPVGGHPKHLHQDSSYFEHRFEGPVGVLCYAVDTDLINGALHVVPGSHRQGTLRHVDTFSHLGLDPDEWPWEASLPICGRAGDAIFFHYRTIHGSKENHSHSSRPVFIHRFRRPDDYVTISASNAKRREELEQQPAPAAKPSQQRGLMVRGRRPWDGA